MPSLSDHIDRLANTARSIRSAATVTASSAAPIGNAFTAAVLDTPLGDLIRDADPSELGLFTLLPPAPVARHPGAREPDPMGPPAEIARVEVVSATPLRKHPTVRREDVLRPKEPEPEVYAEAALKYLERYWSIRPMPRAQSQVTAILEQLHEIRQNMKSLDHALQQAKTAGPSDLPGSPKSLANEEERRIHDLNTRIKQLQTRKETLQKKRSAPRHLGKAKATRAPLPEPSPSTPKADVQEDMFWGTPGGPLHTPARTLQFNDLLLNEQVDLGDVTSSFASPVSAVRSRSISRPSSSMSMQELSVDEPEEHIDPVQEPEPEQVEEPDVTVQPRSPDSDNGEPEQDAEDDNTIIFNKQNTPPPSAPPDANDPSEVEIVPPTPLRPRVNPANATPSRSARRPKVRITNEVERITSKIWATVGDLIMPGHPFDTSGSGVHRPPHAKETITHLQSLASQFPEPPSPTASSLSSVTNTANPSGKPNLAQILTAHMLLALLSTPPNFALPLTKLKEVLSAKNAASGSTGILSNQVSTRVLYGCVAKRLVKIDRGGGEQVVKFDV